MTGLAENKYSYNILANWVPQHLADYMYDVEKGMILLYWTGE